LRCALDWGVLEREGMGWVCLGCWGWHASDAGLLLEGALLFGRTFGPGGHSWGPGLLAIQAGGLLGS
jgi:hypothetical protein